MTGLPPLVVDASAIAAWILPDETRASVAPKIRAHGDLYAPWLFWAELRNLLIVNERRGRIGVVEAGNALANVQDLEILLDTSPDSGRVMDLARLHRLTVYDALYLELVLRRGASLLSLDAPLIAAALHNRVTIA